MKGNSRSPKNRPPISSGDVSHAASTITPADQSVSAVSGRVRRTKAAAPELPPATSAVSHAGPTRWSVV